MAKVSLSISLGTYDGVGNYSGENACKTSDGNTSIKENLQRIRMLIDHTDFDSARAVVENDEWPGHLEDGRGKFGVIPFIPEGNHDHAHFSLFLHGSFVEHPSDHWKFVAYIMCIGLWSVEHPDYAL
jgi:hypothetical protein